MSSPRSIILYSEIFTIEQKLRASLSAALPSGMELSHFSTLNHLIATQGDASPLQLSKALGVSKGAITNTLSRLEKMGYIHIHNDWDDARRKRVAISKSGRLARDIAIQETAPIFNELDALFEEEHLKQLIASLRKLRIAVS